MKANLVGGVLLAAIATSGCEPLLVEPASSPTTAISLALAPTAPNLAIAPAEANRIRIQVNNDGQILLDTIYAFDPQQEEVLVPVRFEGSGPGGVSVLVEIGEDQRPLLRGSTEIALRQRRVIDAVVPMASAFVRPLEPAFELTTGIYHSCATAGEGALFCWGNNDEGQLGTGKLTPTSMPEFIEGSGGFYDISAGFLTTCGLAFEGAAFCWGDNEFGSLGSGTSLDRTAVPVPVAFDGGFSTLTVNGLHACGLSFEGEAWCWGFNGFGQLGDGTTTNRFTPVRAAPQLRFVSISAGYVHTCGVATSGQTYCWGLNEFGQLGDGTTTDRSAPALVAGNHLFLEVSAGGLHSCGLERDGDAFCWGFNGFGGLGDGTTQDRSTPAVITSSRFSSLSAGGLHTCGIDVDNDARCWGYNRSGALGDDTFEDRSTPTVVTGSHSFEVLRAGLHHTCGITTANAVVCWGYNRFGQLGDGSRVNRAEPGDVLFGSPFFDEFRNNQGELAGAVSALREGRLLPHSSRR